MISEGVNRWWQNWPKTRAYVAQKMFFPKFAGEIASAIQIAEADHRPLRAVGGGWSFSDAALPGMVTTNRPNVYAVEALAEVVPQAVDFPKDRSKVSIASIPDSPPIVDLLSSMVMLDDSLQPPEISKDWTYLGGSSWMWRDGRTYGTNGDDDLRPDFLDGLAKQGGTRAGLRPIRNPNGVCFEEADVAGSLVMFDLRNSTVRPSRDWFYNGNGIWTVGVSGDSPPDQGNLRDLSRQGRLALHPPGKMNLSPRAAHAHTSLSLLLSKEKTVSAQTEPVYLINTRSLVSSLQQQLPSILSHSAADATSSNPSTGERQRFLFHVEAGITIAELGRLLAHQSPRLSLQAISGSPGATLAGALSTSTHGAEFNWPLLVDTVKAVHLVGPGGLQWWIEGDESIADPQKLRAAYPDIPLDRIISGTDAVDGIVAQDWLNAVIVSMGCMGVLYSVVLEVVPLFGVHEIVVQTTWQNLNVGNKPPGTDLSSLLRLPDESAKFSGRIVKMLQAGNLNGTGIVQADSQGNPVNQYADLAINPNRRIDGDYDCWIGNREVAAQVPIDPQPSAANETADMIKGIGMAFRSVDITNKLKNIYGFGSTAPISLDIIGNLFTYSSAWSKLNRLTGAADLIDVALDTILTPMIGQQDGPELAQVFLSGVLSGLLGTANCDGRSDKTGVSVGALGFPESGAMGTGLEIALSPADAFGFLQTEILDQVNLGNDQKKPFFGYVSIRLCSKTETLIGMQQFGDAANPCSVMIEVVGFGTPDSRKFIQDLQRRTVNRIQAGLDAMLHWGLENDQLQGHHLRSIKALQKPTRSGLSKLGTFIAVRSRVHTAAPATYRVFDNSFTERLGLSDSQSSESYDFGTLQLHVRKSETFHFRNEGSSSLQIRGLIASGDFHTEDVPPSPLLGTPGRPHNFELTEVHTTALPGEEIEVIATFIAERPGPHLGTLTIETNDSGLPGGIKIGLHALVDVFNLALVEPLPPAGLDLGVVGIGEYKIVQLVLRNDSTSNAYLESYTFSDPAVELQIGVETGSISKGQTRAYTLTYQPESLVPLATNLTLHFTDGIAPSRHSQDVVVKVTANTHMPTIFLASRAQQGSRWSRELQVLDFGAAAPNRTSTASFWIRNVGDAPLTVQGVVEFNRGNFGVISPAIFPAILQPGGEMEVPCGFLAPPVPGTIMDGQFSIGSNDPIRPSVALWLKGRAAGPHLTEPMEFEQGVVIVSPPSPVTFTFRSDGTAPVTVKETTLIGLNPGTNFSVSGVPQLPATLAPGTELKLTVTLIANLPGVYEADLRVTHDGNPRMISGVRLHGNAP